MGREKFFTLLAKPTYACNMCCPQCYLKYERTSRKGTMDDNILKALILKAAKVNVDYLNLQWIGGESLLVGTEFYQKAIDLIREYSGSNIYIDQWIQTNASLINDEWIQFLCENRERIHLSISFEVTRELQEKLRPMHTGASSFELVKKRIKLLNENNVPYGVLSVITNDTVKTEPTDWLKAVVDLGIKAIGLQICYQDFFWGDIENTYLCMDWINKLFQAQAQYNQRTDKENCIVIRESLYLYHLLRETTVRYTSCHNSSVVCSDYLLTVDMNGDVYGYCDAFMGTNDGDESFLLGNVAEDEFETIFLSEKYKNVRKIMLQGKLECQNCDVVNFCNGGCSLFKGRMVKNGRLIPFSHNNYCVIQKRLFSYLKNIPQRLLLRDIYWFYENNAHLPTPLDLNMRCPHKTETL